MGKKKKKDKVVNGFRWTTRWRRRSLDEGLHEKKTFTTRLKKKKEVGEVTHLPRHCPGETWAQWVVG